MKRRHLLQKGIVAAVAITLFPSRGWSLGGSSPDIGSSAPDFDLPGTNLLVPQHSRWSLADWKGRWLVLYFYPRDFTSGCTIEAHGFQDSLANFSSLNCDVAAISADSVEDHESFCSSEDLGFTLLSDHDGEVSRNYGSWMAPYSLRHTFLIDPSGLVQARWTGVRPVGHAKEVLETLQKLQST
nr:peroxiredoxin [Synechococcus sp. WH 7805]